MTTSSTIIAGVLFLAYPFLACYLWWRLRWWWISRGLRKRLEAEESAQNTPPPVAVRVPQNVEPSNGGEITLRAGTGTDVSNPGRFSTPYSVVNQEFSDHRDIPRLPQLPPARTFPRRTVLPTTRQELLQQEDPDYSELVRRVSTARSGELTTEQFRLLSSALSGDVSMGTTVASQSMEDYIRNTEGSGLHTRVGVDQPDARQTFEGTARHLDQNNTALHVEGEGSFNNLPDDPPPGPRNVFEAIMTTDVDSEG